MLLLKNFSIGVYWSCNSFDLYVKYWIRLVFSILQKRKVLKPWQFLDRYQLLTGVVFYIKPFKADETVKKRPQMEWLASSILQVCVE